MSKKTLSPEGDEPHNRMPDSEWSFERLNVRNGESQILETFWQTIRNHGLTEETSIVRAPTTFAAPFLKRTGIRPELVYVDADHSFMAVLEDLRLARSIVRDGGVIAGDDFTWQSIRLALARFVTGGRHGAHIKRPQSIRGPGFNPREP
jgi:hypothetical protein